MRITTTLLLMALGLATAAQAADHRDSPLAISDPAADINDVYTFVNPRNRHELIIVGTVLPLANAGSRFSNAVQYRFHIDNGRRNGKSTINCTFPKGTRVECALDRPGDNHRYHSFHRANGRIGAINHGLGFRVFAGLRDDPFFFDLDAFNRTKNTLTPSFTDPGVNFFGSLNTLAIVIGVDSRLLTDHGRAPILAVYASTSRKAANGGSIQIDRMGRPGINTALIDLLASTGKKDAYNRAANPAAWASQFQQEISDNLAALDTLDGAINAVLPAPALASLLVDDRLRVNTAIPACDAYLAVELGIAGQCGGRTLARDVIDDTFGAVVGPGVSDFVRNDSIFLTRFPFLGEPN
jgi:hypothetical protein